MASNDPTFMPLGYGVADLLVADLAISPQLQLVDRLNVDAIMRELDLGKSGRADTLSAPSLGKLVGASRLVNGVITPVSKSHLTMDARVTSVEKGSIVGRPVSQSTALVEILDAEKALASQLFDELGVTLTPAQRAAFEKRPTRYLSAFLAYARGATLGGAVESRRGGVVLLRRRVDRPGIRPRAAAARRRAREFGAPAREPAAIGAG